MSTRISTPVLIAPHERILAITAGFWQSRALWAGAALSVPLVFLPLYAHVEALLVLVSSAGHHWSPPRITQRSYLTPLSDRSGTHHDGADGLRMEQQRVVDS
jgi:hypothetical protein